VRALAVHPQNPEIVYAGTQSGPYRSADRGDTWNACTLHGNALTALHALAFARD